MWSNIVIFACLCFSSVVFANTGKNETVFVPTREWQTVKKGTPIPEGLHVRHNFQTGVTEAKLMDTDDADEKNSKVNSSSSDSKSVALHPDENYQSQDDVSKVMEKSDLLKYSVDELKERLKKIKQEEAEGETETMDENIQRVKHKFRDYETIKKTLKSIGVNITTDSEFLSHYFQKFEPHKNGIVMGTLKSTEIEEVLDILYNLEYLLHHIDNAKVFADMQGMNKIVSPCLNGTNNEIKAEALKLLGTAVQSNPRVQIKALENDCVQKLLHILSTSNKIEVKSRCLFALSALIRQFPAAQKVWLDHGGLEIIGKILIGDQMQVQMKVMKLIGDLITERENLQEITDAEQQQKRKKAYAVTEFEQKLLVHEYCKHLSDLMTRSFTDELSDQSRTEDYEFLEIISDSMITATPVCKIQFASNKHSLLPVIRQLLEFYQKHDSSDEQDENDVLKNLTLLIERLQSTVSQISHDEL